MYISITPGHRESQGLIYNSLVPMYRESPVELNNYEINIIEWTITKP